MGIKLTLAVAWLAATMICSSEVARASSVFDLTGTWADGSAVSGTLTIDTSTGTVVAANLLYLGETYSTIQTQGSFTGDTAPGQTPVAVDYAVDIGTSTSVLPRIDLGIKGTSAVDSLIGYAGGVLCTQCGPDQIGANWSTAFHAFDGAIIFLEAGELVASPSPTPLPAALPLFASGLGALGVLGWRRTRKAQVIAA